MNRLYTRKPSVSAWPVRQRTLTAALTLLVTAASLAAGCSGKDKSASTAPPAAGQTGANTTPGEPKLTPEQEAAKQRAIQQGPAVEAAMREGTGR